MGAEQNKNKPGKNPQPIRPTKFTPTGALQQFEKQTEQQAETSTSSVSLVKNSKGVNIGVKVYDTDPVVAKRVAEKLFDNLDEKYSTKADSA